MACAPNATNVNTATIVATSAIPLFMLRFLCLKRRPENILVHILFRCPAITRDREYFLHKLGMQTTDGESPLGQRHRFLGDGRVLSPKTSALRGSKVLPALGRVSHLQEAGIFEFEHRRLFRVCH